MEVPVRFESGHCEPSQQAKPRVSSIYQRSLTIYSCGLRSYRHRLFGLIIGINNYNKTPQVDSSSPYFGNLSGAVADAKNFYKYLTHHQNVPEQQITLLCDEKATRTEIIKAFQSLGNEDNGIRKGDSIVIFYAGHGAQALPPKRLLGTDGCPKYTEVLLPYDFNGNRPYMGIPDYTLGSLLATIAENKGDNIVSSLNFHGFDFLISLELMIFPSEFQTVIFDCCHSASSLRGPRLTPPPVSDDAGSSPITRGGPALKYNIPDDLDEAIWTRKTDLPRLRHSGATSYVFFAACDSTESAKEVGGQGYFTSALLALLTKEGTDMLPCSQIILRLGTING